MSAATRLKLGIGLLILGLLMPAGTLIVAVTDWPAGVKAVVSGVLVFGLEILLIPAVALMGKENFDHIVSRAKGVLKWFKPAGNVGRTRYKVGLWLFVCPVVFAWIASYDPDWMPESPAGRLAVNLAVDLTLLASVFVLGGDFWDKLRALFVYEARAVFPAAATPENRMPQPPSPQN
jgi:hypothetical protein